MPELSVRAVTTGLVLGFLLSFGNVYIGLKTGWFFSMALAACLAAFGLWRIVQRPLSPLEINCAQSTASSAAYATGNMVVGVIPALLLLSGEQPAWWQLVAWIGCISLLGISFAVPLKRQLIDREGLAFPSGTAAGIMLRGLHQSVHKVAIDVRYLAASLGIGALLPLLRDLRGLAVIPASSRLFDWLPHRYLPSGSGLVLDHSLLLVGAGVFVGLRTTAWMFIGGLVTVFVLGPIALESGDATRPALVWADVGTWLGAPMLVAYASVALLANWRAFASVFRRATGESMDGGLPISWFWTGLLTCGALAVVLGYVLFGIPIVVGVLAVLLSLVFAAVAARVTGETDITPGGPMGKLTQLGFGALYPQHPSTNLMTAAMTHASSVACADALNNLKCGTLLGANPRRQLVAQMIGVAAGATASVLAYLLLIPDASVLVGDAPQFAAPGAHQFRAIAVLLQDGFANLHPMHRMLVVIGAIAGLVLATIERIAPQKLVPSAAGLGLGVLLPASTSLSMLIGAVLAAVLARRSANASERIVWPMSAGVLAGESLAGVAVVLANTLLA